MVITREVNGGIVPMDGQERAWRERHGVLVQRLAREAEHVTRVLCGLTEVLEMKLTLLRHGETEGKPQRIVLQGGHIPVLPESLEELKKRAAAGVYPTGKRYYTSGMLRAEQTLRAIYGDVPFTVLPGLREMDFGDFRDAPL